MFMISKIYAITVNGLECDIIHVEVDINQGLPSFTIVGLPDQSVQESKERLRSALKSSGFKLPTTRITVNLAPADIRKSWPSFDVALAVWILSHMWEIEDNTYLQNSIFLWELSLNGELRSVSGILPSVIGAKEKWFQHIFVPYENYSEASVIDGIDIFPVRTLEDLVWFLKGRVTLPSPSVIENTTTGSPQESKYDFAYVVWQRQARRALEIAAAGLHNIIMSGPPWSGKTLLAKTFATILPDLEKEEMVEISKIYSISGLLSKENPLIDKRPFRSVHHTASSISIIGGGRNAKPWEISLSHKGVLFLDEVLEFPKMVLEVLRQPLEDGVITVNRVNSSYTYPAKFVLVGAMNPCPCGYLTDPDASCVCTMDQIKRYRSKLSGPMVDRIDMMIEVPKVKTQDFSAQNISKEESSADIKKRVQKAYDIQVQRFLGIGITSNSQMWVKEIQKFCKLDTQSTQLLQKAVESMNLSARVYYRILKLSRTIADLEGCSNILLSHIAEALSYRQQE